MAGPCQRPRCFVERTGVRRSASLAPQAPHLELTLVAAAPVSPAVGKPETLTQRCNGHTSKM
jgi:hypothetical protein